MHGTRIAVLVLSSCLTVRAFAQVADEELAELDFSSLMRIEVTTAAKVSQTLSEIAAPVHVITAEDIRRAGATSIPEALRMAPGVNVAQIDSSKWVVSIRGFAWEYSNKALILLDGRALHTPLNSSIYWNTMDVVMEDIERIEVIRGPGDARWGSHALNGIINIISKTAGETHGVRLMSTLDTEGSEHFTARYGGKLSAGTDIRAYAKYVSLGDFPLVSGARLDDLHTVRAGVRADSLIGLSDELVFIADVQDTRDAIAAGSVSGGVPTAYDATEWSALARWEHSPAGSANQQVQASFAQVNQEVYERRATFDFAYQSQLLPLGAHSWTLGATFKHTSDDIVPVLGISPGEQSQQTYGAFVHDRIGIGPKTTLLLGSQYEHNPYTGWEIQPSAQLVHSPREGRSYWLSLARGVRAPLRTDESFNLSLPLFPGGELRIQGNTDLEAEDIISAQTGARLSVGRNVFVDLSAFYNHYSNLILIRAAPSFFEPLPPPGTVVFPLVTQNAESGGTKGVEVAMRALVHPRVELAASYTYFEQPDWLDESGFAVVTAFRNQYQLHSSVKITKDLYWNTALYHVDAPSSGGVSGYDKLDSQLAWALSETLQLRFGIKNALSPWHREVGISSVNAPARIPRTGYMQISWDW